MEEQVLFAEGVWDPWVEHTATGRVTIIVSVPVGYDGFVFGIFNNTLEWPEDGYVYDFYDPDTFFMFRMA